MFRDPNQSHYNSIEKHDISSFFPFSPPTLHQDYLQDLFFSVPGAADGPQRPPHQFPAEVPVPSASSQSFPGIRRKPRKDRHSKIYTAQGVRDRRMRLSLDVAHNFFALQDLLSFDTASKTVQWLLKKSKHAIKELKTASEKDRSEEDSSILSEPNSKRAATVIGALKSWSSRQSKVTRESREKARARARERTLNKKTIEMKCGRHVEGSKRIKESFLQAITFSGFNGEPCSLEPKPSLEHCSTSFLRCNEAHYNGSIALFEYNQSFENSVQEPWEKYMENDDEREFAVDHPFQMSYVRPVTPSMLYHV